MITNNKEKDCSIYDSAKNHFLGNFPDTLPMENAYTHIGMYLGWVIERGLYSEYFEEEGFHQIFRFKRKEISCIILSEIWEGKLGSTLFNKSGNMFSGFYYKSGLYQKDYRCLLANGLPSLYHVSDDWENFHQLKNLIDIRFRDWSGH